MAGTQPGIRDVFVEANGLRHHLVARGMPGAPVVMMIHGLAGQARTFDGIATRLAANYHVYCLDVRGRGESGWGPPDEYSLPYYLRDLETIHAALGLGPMALVGTSMGGQIAMNYAPQHADHVTKVLLNDIGPELDPAGGARIMGYFRQAPDAFHDMKAVVRYYRENYAPMIRGLDEEAVAEFARWNVRKSDTGLYVWKMDPAVRRASPPPPGEDPWAVYGRITCPVLVVRGAESDILSPATAKKMVEVGPQARLVEVPGVGHAPVLTEAVAATALERFLGE